MPHQSGAPFASVRRFPKEQWYRAGVFFFLPSPSSLSFFRPRTYRKGYYYYSPQSSTVIKSKMAATTTLRTRTRFRPPKIRLQCRLGIWLSESSRGWGIWTVASISCEISGSFAYGKLSWQTWFLWKRLCLCGQLVMRKGLKQALCCIWRC